MKILLLNYEFPPMGGGAGRATCNIARELVRLGHDVDVLTSGIVDHETVSDMDGVTLYRVKALRKNIHDCGLLGAFVYVFFAYFRLLQLVRKKDYDILHYFFSMPTGLLSQFPGKHRKIPYIVSLRGSDVPHYDTFNWRLELMHAALQPVTKRIWKKAMAVVALSKSLRETALELAPNLPIDIIRNGINTDVFAPRHSDKRGGPLRLIAVCRLLERKGLQYVMAALAELADPNITLTIVGLGNYEKELKKLCDYYGLGATVSFHGYCENCELPLVFKDSDVFILTSLAESFGIVFLEAMSCSLPIIGGRTGGIPGIVAEENGILVEPTDIDAIKEAILTMMRQPELRKEMGERNRQKMIDQYSWRHVAEEYLNIYTSSVNKNLEPVFSQERSSMAFDRSSTSGQKQYS